MVSGCGQGQLQGENQREQLRAFGFASPAILESVGK